MKLLVINSVIGYGSTGRIVYDIARNYIDNGWDARVAYGISNNAEEENSPIAIKIGNELDLKWHILYSRQTGKHGLASKLATRKFLKWASEYNPDELWLHNIHGYYINYVMLFEWIKARPNMRVKWTLHDCWAFTGHCAHFSYVKCYKWKTENGGCKECPQLSRYPKCVVDNSEKNYLMKRRSFMGVYDMTIIVPSHWLEHHVKNSFMSGYKVNVVYNRINMEVFKPQKSHFKEIHGIGEDIMILGVANCWDERKGLKDFIGLQEIIDSNAGKHGKYRIVLIGVNEVIAQNLTSSHNIICLPRTNSAEELAEIYSAADIYVNPSYEETFGLTTLEAQSCGTFTIVYKGTACEEILDKSNGVAIESGSKAIFDAIINYAKK